MTAEPARIPDAAVEAYGRAYDAAFLRLGGYTAAELARAETEGIRAGLVAAAPWIAAQALREVVNRAGSPSDRPYAWISLDELLARADELERGQDGSDG